MLHKQNQLTLDAAGILSAHHSADVQKVQEAIAQAAAPLPPTTAAAGDCPSLLQLQWSIADVLCYMCVFLLSVLVASMAAYAIFATMLKLLVLDQTACGHHRTHKLGMHCALLEAMKPSQKRFCLVPSPNMLWHT